MKHKPRCKPWTTGEVARLKAWLAAGLPVREVAARLGRTPAAVCRQFRRHGGPARRRPRFGPLVPKALALHARGLCAVHIARTLKHGRWSVANALRQQGLTPHGHGRCPSCQKTLSATYRRTFKGTSLTRVRDEVWAVRAAQAGWPGARNPGDVEILELLRERGPLFVREVARLLGKYLHPTSCYAGQKLRRLAAAGLVTSQRHGRRLVYAVAPGACRRVPA